MLVIYHQLTSKESPPPRSSNFTTSGPVVTPVHGELERAREPYPPAQLTPPAGSTCFAHGAPRPPLHPAHTQHTFHSPTYIAHASIHSSTHANSHGTCSAPRRQRWATAHINLGPVNGQLVCGFIIPSPTKLVRKLKLVTLPHYFGNLYTLILT